MDSYSIVTDDDIAILAVGDYRVIFHPRGAYIEKPINTNDSHECCMWQFELPFMDSKRFKLDDLENDKGAILELIDLVKKFHNLINYGDTDKAE